jgi:hypothetical protein
MNNSLRITSTKVKTKNEIQRVDRICKSSFSLISWRKVANIKSTRQCLLRWFSKLVYDTEITVEIKIKNFQQRKRQKL